MALWIVAGMVGALVFGYSMVLVLVIGAVAMSALSFFLTRDKRIALIGLSFGLLVLNHLVLQNPSITQELNFPAWTLWLASDDALAIFAIVTIFCTMFLGLFGPMRHLPLDPEGVVRMVKDREKDDQSSKD